MGGDHLVALAGAGLDAGGSGVAVPYDPAVHHHHHAPVYPGVPSDHPSGSGYSEVERVGYPHGSDMEALAATTVSSAIVSLSPGEDGLGLGGDGEEVGEGEGAGPPGSPRSELLLRSIRCLTPSSTPANFTLLRHRQMPLTLDGLIASAAASQLGPGPWPLTLPSPALPARGGGLPSTSASSAGPSGPGQAPAPGTPAGSAVRTPRVSRAALGADDLERNLYDVMAYVQAAIDADTVVARGGSASVDPSLAPPLLGSTGASPPVGVPAGGVATVSSVHLSGPGGPGSPGTGAAPPALASAPVVAPWRTPTLGPAPPPGSGAAVLAPAAVKGASPEGGARYRVKGVAAALADPMTPPAVPQHLLPPRSRDASMPSLGDLVAPSLPLPPPGHAAVHSASLFAAVASTGPGPSPPSLLPLHLVPGLLSTTTTASSTQP